MSFIYPDLQDRERTCIKEKVKSRDKYTCLEIPFDPVEMTVQYLRCFARLREIKTKVSKPANLKLCSALFK